MLWLSSIVRKLSLSFDYQVQLLIFRQRCVVSVTAYDNLLSLDRAGLTSGIQGYWSRLGTKVTVPSQVDTHHTTRAAEEVNRTLPLLRVIT